MHMSECTCCADFVVYPVLIVAVGRLLWSALGYILHRWACRSSFALGSTGRARR
jgi:hypothetical protein